MKNSEKNNIKKNSSKILDETDILYLNKKMGLTYINDDYRMTLI